MSGVRESVWNDTLGYVQVKYPNLMRGWFSDLKPVNLMHGVLEIRALNGAQQRYLQNNCTTPFIEGAQAATGMLVTVHFTADDLEEPNRSETLCTFEKETEELHLNGEYAFDQFVTGPCNRLAYSASIAVSEEPGKTYNPLFLHGSVGLGKTHLLQAACHEIRKKWPEKKILYLSGETFANHFVEAVERGALHQFRNRYRHVDALVIDDIHFLGQRERSQEEFYHTFNALYQTQRQIILSADTPPRDIRDLTERITSRFNWGLVAGIDPPSFETRMAILRKKAKLRCIEVPDDVVEFVAMHIESNTRELEGAVNKLDALSQQMGGKINMEVAIAALGEGRFGPHIKIANIQEIVVRHFNVKVSDLQGKRRNKSVVIPRQLIMYLARELTDLSLEEIGDFFGGRDHTTVIHAHKQISRVVETDRLFKTTVDKLRSEIEKGTPNGSRF